MALKKKAASRRRPIVDEPQLLAVAVRRQTAEENRQYRVALQLLLSEMVRQQLGSGERENEEQ